ncbi:MAG TPA: RdgB/HAM1 family non-canonical purine NTP pyrophosphatase [Burkholderiales bacterium]|nr:RdgB/HAM1 family non-canonical purine NTP pyrophosphatase [Burkholderiales bacterium]
MKRVVIATGNPGKLREIAALIAPLGIEVVPQSEFNVPPAQEPHATFVENALAKARHASRLSGLPALADDSGLCAAALGGVPGVQSARFAGVMATDADNNAKLLDSLKRAQDRRAHYVCVIALMRSEFDPQPIICEAEWHGEIIGEPRGSGGFGYDPLFLIPELGLTGAELSLEHKNRISHRGRALAQLVGRLRAECES